MTSLLLLLVGLACFYVVIGPGRELENEAMKKQRALDRNMICPYCHATGTVTTTKVKKKSGIHGGKATAAVLTAGLTLIGTGLSRKNTMTQAHCSKCGATYTF